MCKWRKSKESERTERETNKNPGTKRKSLKKQTKMDENQDKNKTKIQKLGKSKTKEDKLKYYMYDRNTREKGYGLNL